MLSRFYVLVLLLFIVSCGWSSDKDNVIVMSHALSNYSIDYDLLEDGESLKPLAISMTYFDRLDTNSFAQLLAIRLATMDTVNVFIPITTQLKANDGDRIFTFKNIDYDMNAKIQENSNKLATINLMLSNQNDSIIDQKTMDSLVNMVPKLSAFYVHIDPKMKDLFHNTHPITFGFIKLANWHK